MNHTLKKNWIFIIIVAVFLLSRLAALSQIYHQDEYKWAMIVNPHFGLDLKSNHPPLVSIIYRAAGELVGFEYLRVVPILFGLLTLIMVYLITTRLYGKRAALWSAFIITVSVYSIVATTQIDIDGALLPSVSLLLIYSYYRIDWQNLRERHNYKWIVLGLLSVALGLLIKLSFVLVIVALLSEFVIINRPDKKLFLRMTGIISAALIAVAALAFVLIKLFGIADSTDFIRYVTHFGVLNFGERNYGQVLFLTVKAAVLASPLLLAWYIIVFTKREYIRRYRFWLILLLYNVLFYYILFDFTNRTMERYLMFLIVPSAIIAGSIIAGHQFTHSRKRIIASVASLTASCVAVSFWIQNKALDILPLNPKAAYIERLKNLDFNFLIPITGGSGPVGFYAAVPYIIFFFLISGAAIIAFRLTSNRHLKSELILSVIVIGVVCNVFLTVEFLFGMFNGSVNSVAREIAGEVVRREDVKSVTTYYDVGGYELNLAGKYTRRFYTDPMFAQSNKDKFATFSGHYMVLNFPLIDPQSAYWQYLNTCRRIFSTQSGRVQGHVFDCALGDRTLFK